MKEGSRSISKPFDSIPKSEAGSIRSLSNASELAEFTIAAQAASCVPAELIVLDTSDWNSRVGKTKLDILPE